MCLSHGLFGLLRIALFYILGGKKIATIKEFWKIFVDNVSVFNACILLAQPNRDPQDHPTYDLWMKKKKKTSLSRREKSCLAYDAHDWFQV